ncbi:hypothetical protein Lalb_Chr23g0270901 [Lupinus albus]|uniref:Uncharacterized protein n=2 Tax=Lupinus albus TaxID=3870 RepID=A0A6A4NKV2_LUPAL|nr:hypothetical protein Lalb_Chr23g0270901 [Lupinus albus]
MFNTTFQFIYFFFSKSFFFILSQQQPPSPPPQPSLILAPHPCLNPNADTHQQQLPQFINLLMLPLHSFTPLPPELTSPLSTDAIVSSEETKQEPRKGFPMWLDYASCMFQLAVFGIFGV